MLVGKIVENAGKQVNKVSKRQSINTLNLDRYVT